MFQNNHVEEKYWPQYYQGRLFIFIIFLGYVVYWYLQGGYRFPKLGSIRFEFIIGFILTVFAIPEYFNNPNRKKIGIAYWVNFLFFIMLIMIVFSFVPEFSFNIFIDRVVKFSLFGLFISAFVTTPKRLLFFIGTYLLVCLKIGQEGLLGNITGSLIWENQGVMRLHGSTPNYLHPNSFSGMALGYLPFILYFYPVVPRYLRIVLLIELGLMLHIIIVTGSRTGYFGLLGGLVFLILKSNNKIKLFLFTIVSAVLISQFIPEQYFERAQTLTVEQEGEQGGIAARQQILRDALQVFLDNPLGIGVSAFPAVRQHLFGRIQDTHNLYLEILTNLGIEGFIAFFGFIFTLLRISSKIVKCVSYQIKQVDQVLTKLDQKDLYFERGQRHLHDLQVMLATAKAIFIFLIIRLFLGLFGHDLYEIYWWFALGTIVAIWNINTVSQCRTDIFCNDYVNLLSFKHRC